MPIFKSVLLFFALSGYIFPMSAQLPRMILVEGDDFLTSYGKQVKINSFYIDPYEVTIGDFKRFVDATGHVTQAEIEKSSTIMGGEKKDGINWRYDAWAKPVDVSAYDVTPVCYVSYQDMLAFCAWAGKRLLREEEWEYAFREGKKNSTFRYSGSNAGRRVAVSEEFGSVTTTSVGQKAPNALGIYDLSGNYNEMVVVDDNYVIIRGGSFVDDASCLTYERKNRPMPVSEIEKDHMWYFGFRCAKDEK